MAEEDVVTIADIRAAAERLRGQIEETPCVHSRTLSQITGAEVYLKFENLQFTASFKERGALNCLAQLADEQRRRGVIAVSAGNHAQGVAYHAQRLGVPAVIVMPRYTPMVKVERTRGFGAEIVLAGENFDEAKVEALRLQASRSLTLVHPYDDPRVIAGQGTIGLEMLAAQPQLDCLCVAIGGGGLSRRELRRGQGRGAAAAGVTRPDAGAPVRRSARDRRAGHDRAGNARRAAAA